MSGVERCRLRQTLSWRELCHLEAVSGDYDACWDPAGVSGKLDPRLYDSALRLEQNREYRGDLMIGAAGDGPEHENFRFLSRDKITGSPKGIVGIKLNMVEILNI